MAASSDGKTPTGSGKKKVLTPPTTDESDTESGTEYTDESDDSEEEPPPQPVKKTPSKPPTKASASKFTEILPEDKYGAAAMARAKRDKQGVSREGKEEQQRGAAARRKKAESTNSDTETGEDTPNTTRDEGMDTPSESEDETPAKRPTRGRDASPGSTGGNSKTTNKLAEREQGQRRQSRASRPERDLSSAGSSNPTRQGKNEQTRSPDLPPRNQPAGRDVEKGDSPGRRDRDEDEDKCCGFGGCGGCCGLAGCWAEVVDWRIWSWSRRRSAYLISGSLGLGMIAAGGTGVVGQWTFVSVGGYDLGGLGYCQA